MQVAEYYRIIRILHFFLNVGNYNSSITNPQLQRKNHTIPQLQFLNYNSSITKKNEKIHK